MKTMLQKIKIKVLLVAVLCGITIGLYAQPSNAYKQFFEEPVFDDFIVMVKVLPFDESGTGEIDALLSLAQDSLKEYGDFAVGVRFFDDNTKDTFYIEARNGASYTQDIKMEFKLNDTVYIFLEVSPALQTYNVYVSIDPLIPPDLIAVDYLFRNTATEYISFMGTHLNTQSARQNPLQIISWQFLDEVAFPTPTNLVRLKENSVQQTIYPNPVFSQALVHYMLPAHGKVTVEILDLQGKLVKTLVKETKTAGEYTTMITSNELNSGIYFCRISVNEYTNIQKLIIAE